MTPQPLQRKRMKGFRYPEGAKVLTVTRGTVYGNPYRIRAVNDGQLVCVSWSGKYFRSFVGDDAIKRATEHAVDMFREHMHHIKDFHPWKYSGMMKTVLQSDFIACWCEIGQPCHRDVLIELALEWQKQQTA